MDNLPSIEEQFQKWWVTLPQPRFGEDQDISWIVVKGDDPMMEVSALAAYTQGWHDRTPAVLREIVSALAEAKPEARLTLKADGTGYVAVADTEYFHFYNLGELWDALEEAKPKTPEQQAVSVIESQFTFEGKVGEAWNTIKEALKAKAVQSEND